MNRRWTAEGLHAALAGASLWAAFALRFDFRLDSGSWHLLVVAVPAVLAAKIVVFRLLGLQQLAWRYTGFQDLLRITAANALGSALGGALARLTAGTTYPRSIPILDFVLCLALISGARAFAKLFYDLRGARGVERRRIAVYGAGRAGWTLISEIRANPEIGYDAVAFFDDDPEKRGLRIQGIKVLGGRAELPGEVKERGIELVLIALPNASGSEFTAILEECHRARVEAKRIPALAELMENKVLVEQIRDVRLEDLLGRPPVELDESTVRQNLRGKTVMVTGAGGSIGSELCRQIARFDPAAIIGFDHSEGALYQIDQELGASFPELAFHAEIGSIQSRRRLEEVFREYRPQTVYHAAAYKHVPLMESHLFEAVENNVFGTDNLVRVASRFDAEEFVLVSSDKAVRPANVMGATKRLAEMVTMASGVSVNRTRFCAVRFGNVLGSSGSVIPLFQRQIAQGGPVTVTHPEMRRFFMTIPEAAQLVLQAATMSRGGDIFVLDMGEPVRIVDLARKLVLLNGLQPGEDIRIEFSGVRPGEKLYEELSAYEEDTVPTPHSKIRIFMGPRASRNSLAVALEDLRFAAESGDAGGVVLSLKELMPDYNPSGFLLRKSFQPVAHALVRAVSATPTDTAFAEAHQAST
jgi:FlaA1/EpsC-like NDP-sugar epimerase